MTLVCRRWRRVYYASPDVWRSILLDPSPQAPEGAWLACKARLLRRVGHLVADAELRSTHQDRSASRHQAQLLEALHPSVVTGVTLNYRQHASQPEAAVCALRRFHRHLTRLDLSTYRLPACTSDVLRQLAALRLLRCCSQQAPDDLLEAAAALPALTSLELVLGAPLSVALASTLGLLTTLRHLCCWAVAELPPEAWSGIAALPALTALQLKAGQHPAGALGQLAPLARHLRRLELDVLGAGKDVALPAGRRPLQLGELTALAGLQEWRLGRCSLTRGLQVCACPEHVPPVALPPEPPLGMLLGCRLLWPGEQPTVRVPVRCKLFHASVCSSATAGSTAAAIGARRQASGQRGRWR